MVSHHDFNTSVMRALILMAAISGSIVTQVDAQTAPSVSDAATILAQMSDIGGVHLSPDGKWVVYSVTRRSIARNEVTAELLLQQIPDGEGPLPDTLHLPAGATGVRWCPDSQCLGMIVGGSGGTRSLVRYML